MTTEDLFHYDEEPPPPSAALCVVLEDPERPGKPWITVLQGGTAGSGISIRCRVCDGGIYQGAELSALVASSLAAGFEISPLEPKMRVLVHLLGMHPGGLCIATNSVPGGLDLPLPAAVGGVPITEEGVGEERVFSPGKRVGIRFYMLGRPFTIRLKGRGQVDPEVDGVRYGGEFFIEGDDGEAGQNAAVRFGFDTSEEPPKLVFKVCDADGAFMQVGRGIFTACSPNGRNKMTISDDGFSVMAKTVDINSEGACRIDGGAIILGLPLAAPATPANACAYSVAGPVNLISSKVFIGPLGRVGRCMATIEVTLGPFETPCGPLSVTIQQPVPVPSFAFTFPPQFPPRFAIPFPNCSSMKRRLTKAAEPAADSEP